MLLKDLRTDTLYMGVVFSYGGYSRKIRPLRVLSLDTGWDYPLVDNGRLVRDKKADPVLRPAARDGIPVNNGKILVEWEDIDGSWSTKPLSVRSVFCLDEALFLRSYQPFLQKVRRFREMEEKNARERAFYESVRTLLIEAGVPEGDIAWADDSNWNTVVPVEVGWDTDKNVYVTMPLERMIAVLTRHEV